MKRVSLFAAFILLSLTLTLSYGYAIAIVVGGNPTDVAFDSHLNEVFVSNNVSSTVSVVSG